MDKRMSLISLTLQQITNPSLVGKIAEQTRIKLSKRKRKIESDQRRKAIITTLSYHGGSMTLKELTNAMQYQMMSVRNLCTTLCNDGLLNRRLNDAGSFIYEIPIK